MLIKGLAILGMELTDLRRKRGGCFQCSITSTTAFVGRFDKGTLPRLVSCIDHGGANTDGGVFGSGCCCNNFFMCYWCCVAFVEGVNKRDGKIVDVAVSESGNFLASLVEYVADFGRGCFVRLPDEVRCMSCSVSSTGVRYLTSVRCDTFGPHGSGFVPATETFNNAALTSKKNNPAGCRSIMLRNCKGEQDCELSSLAGCVFFWPHCIMVRVYLGHRVAHSICKQSSNGVGPGENGVLHAVISEETAKAVPMSGFYEHKKVSVLTDDSLSTSFGLNKKRFVTRWVTYGIPESENGDGAWMHHTQPSVEMIMRSILVEFGLGTECDVGSLLLEPRLASNDLFLGAQVFSGVCLGGYPCDDEMHKWMSRRAGKGGIVVARCGGALGPCDPGDPVFGKFLKRPGVAPRIIRACLVIVMNSAQRCGFYVAYVSPYERVRRVVCHWYDSP